MGHGHANRITDGHKTRGFIPGPSVWPVCCSNCVHPAGNGGSVSIPSCPSATLVRQSDDVLMGSCDSQGQCVLKYLFHNSYIFLVCLFFFPSQGGVSEEILQWDWSQVLPLFLLSPAFLL